MTELYTIRVGPALSFIAYKLNGDLFVPSDGLYSVFQFDTQPGFRGFLSRSKIATVESEDLKAELGMKGNVRFLPGDSVKQLIKLRLVSTRLETSVADYNNAVAGIAVDLAPPVAPGCATSYFDATAHSSPSRRSCSCDPSADSSPRR
jgi:hypothetical protein